MESDSPAEKESPTLLRRIEVMRQRQREVTNEEMQIVMDQRDVALAKVSDLANTNLFACPIDTQTFTTQKTVNLSILRAVAEFFFGREENIFGKRK